MSRPPMAPSAPPTAASASPPNGTLHAPPTITPNATSTTTPSATPNVTAGAALPLRLAEEGRGEDPTLVLGRDRGNRPLRSLALAAVAIVML